MNITFAAQDTKIMNQSPDFSNDGLFDGGNFTVLMATRNFGKFPKQKQVVYPRNDEVLAPSFRVGEILSEFLFFFFAGFWRFDADNSGFITVDNLREILGETLGSEDQAAKILAEVPQFSGWKAK